MATERGERGGCLVSFVTLIEEFTEADHNGG